MSTGVRDTSWSWVDRRAPARLRPFLRLARLDRPIGTWLLLWPGWWAIALAAPDVHAWWPDPLMLLLFAIGAVAMRGAGCTWNDIIDRDIDAQVARTAARPLPSGDASVAAAWAFLVLQSLVGLAVLVQFNGFAIAVGAASIILIAIYPFMKRVTWWPQAFLGFTFNWGALLGWAAVTGTLAWPAILMYLGGIFWTLGYDTIYAHQDKEDDALVGIRSSARRLGEASKSWIGGFYALAAIFFATAGVVQGVGWAFWPFLVAAAIHLAYQVTRVDLDEAASCLAVFRSNRDTGAALFVAYWAGILTA